MSKAGDRMLAFTKLYAREIIPALTDTGVFFVVAIAQGCAESGYGTSPAAKNKNNFFGIMNGGTTMRFSSPKECFNYYANLFAAKDWYVKNNVVGQKTALTQIRAIANSGYYSMTNDETLCGYEGNKVPKGYQWNGYTWTGKKWAGSHFTEKQSADHYYNTISKYVNEFLTRAPFGGQVSSANLQAALNQTQNLQV